MSGFDFMAISFLASSLAIAIAPRGRLTASLHLFFRSFNFHVCDHHKTVLKRQVTNITKLFLNAKLNDADLSTMLISFLLETKS